MGRAAFSVLCLALFAGGLARAQETPAFHPELVFGAKPAAPHRPSLLTDDLRSGLRTFAKDCLVKAEKLAQDKDPYWKARYPVELAVAWTPIDSAHAKSLLEVARLENEKLPADSAKVGTMIVTAWCGLDFDRAVELNKTIGQNFNIAGQLAALDLDRAAALLHGDDDTLQAAYDAMRDDPDLAIRLINAVPEADHETLIANVVSSLADESLSQGEPLIAHLRDPGVREAELDSLVREIGANYPDRALATAMSLQIPDRRASSMASVARLFARTNPRVARYAAQEALAAFAKTKAVDQERLIKYSSFLWDVANVDTPEVRAFLASRPRLDPLRLAAAWAQIDQDHADALAEGVPLASRTRGAKISVSCFGARPSDEFIQYLIGTARRYPERAAALLLEMVPEEEIKNQDPQMGWGAGARGMSVHMAAEKVRDDLAYDRPEQTADFLAALGDKWLLKDEPAKLAAKRLKSDPATIGQAIPLLDEMEWIGGQAVLIPAVRDILARYVSDGKALEALSLASKAPTTEVRTFLYYVIAWRLTTVSPRDVLPVLQGAATDLAKEENSHIVVDMLLELADNALEMAKGD